MRLDPESARAHAVLGVISSQYDWGWQVARHHFGMAVALDPNDATAHQWKGEAHCFQHEFDTCARHLKIAFALDPLSPVMAVAQAFPARFSHDWEEAERLLDEVLQRYPDSPVVRCQLALVYDAQERWPEAVAEFEYLMPLLGEPLIAAGPGRACAALGRLEDARQLLDRLIALRKQRHVTALMPASIFLRLEYEGAVYRWLDVAFEERDEFLSYLGVMHDYSRLRGQARFDAMLARLGLL